LTFIQQAGDSVDAQPLLSVGFERRAHYLGSLSITW
jgi:hypothetical protein